MIDTAPRSVTRVRGPSAATLAKARRYVAEGRVHRVSVRLGHQVFEVRGLTGVWHVTLEGDRLSCSCPLKRGTCSHVTAVAMILRSRGR